MILLVLCNCMETLFCELNGLVKDEVDHLLHEESPKEIDWLCTVHVHIEAGTSCEIGSVLHIATIVCDKISKNKHLSILVSL